MIRLLPFILIPILLLAGLGYWRFQASKPNPVTSQTDSSSGPVEVPATLPGATTEDRVKALEDVISKLVVQINALKPAASPSQSTNSDSRLTTIEGSITDLKTRVIALEKATPVPASASKSVVYIPLGSGGGPWTNSDWTTLNEYQISLDPSNYPGYSNMVLEINFRLSDPTGTGSVRLYNSSDNSTVSSQLDTTSSTYELKTTSSFTIPSGSKSYKLQIKSSESKELFIQSARIKVSF